MPINVPASAKSAFNGNMQNSHSIELPFAAPSFYIVNGDARLEQVGGIHYFGGWACNAENLQLAAETWENRPFPIPGLTATETILANGKKLKVFTARNLLIAPIGVRLYSTLKGDRKQRVAPYTKGATPGIQVLCALGYRDENKVIQPWAPIMLSASGYQVDHLNDSLNEWVKKIKPILKKEIPEMEPSAAASLFWMSVGTFGLEIKTRTVGNGKDVQTITPVSAYIPETLDEKTLESLYVGEDVADWLAELSTKAQEWLQVFKKMEAEKQQQPMVQPEDVPDFIPPEDDIPF